MTDNEFRLRAEVATLRTAHKEALRYKHAADLEIRKRTLDAEDLQERLAETQRQLAEVRKWMADQASGPLGVAVQCLSDALLWADAPASPCPDRKHTASPGAIAVTASLFERVANLEDELNTFGASVKPVNDSIVGFRDRLADLEDCVPGDLPQRLNRICEHVADLEDQRREADDKIEALAVEFRRLAGVHPGGY